MKFSHLREFLEAAQTDELRIAAKKLGISLSVLSKHLSALEGELGVELFVRSGRKTKLTEYGKILQEHGQKLVALEEECLRTLNKKNEGPIRHLVIGMSPVQFREKARILIDEFGQEADNLRIRIASADNRELPELVSNGIVDVAVVRSSAAITRLPDLTYLPFTTDEMVAVLPTWHPLATEPYLTFEQLKEENVVLRSDKSAVYNLCRQGFLDAGCDKQFSYAGHYGTYEIVRKGEGITFFLVKPSFVNSGPPLAVVPIRPAVTTFVDILYKRGKTSSAVREFIQYAMTRYMF